MINIEALFKISYGLYIVASGDKDYGNGYISNTVFQVTSEPARFATACNKDNHTADLIEKAEKFSVSVLHKNTDAKIFGKFGYQSGQNVNKLDSMDIQYGSTGVPVVLNDAIAYLECVVASKIDLGSHWLFIGDLVNSEIIDSDEEAMTYTYYREIRKGVAPKNAPTYVDKSKVESTITEKKEDIYKCLACGEIYDNNIEDVKFEDLPSDWQCPVCGADKEDFEKL